MKVKTGKGQRKELFGRVDKVPEHLQRQVVGDGFFKDLPTSIVAGSSSTSAIGPKIKNFEPQLISAQ